jgi:uncharacterized protein YlxW (UPF0749 family)
LTHGTPGSESGPVTERRASASFGADLLTDLFRNPLDPGYADAAERRRREGPPSSPDRRAGRLATGVVLVLFGLLLSVAYQHVVAGAPAAERTRAGLVGEVAGARAESESLERRAARLRDQVAAERDRVLGGGAEADRLRDLEAGTGLSRVAGPGTSVRLTDGPPEVDPVSGEPTGENLGRVLDRDLQRVVNALWAAGAEAVAVNNQRLSAVSTIRGAGEAVLVDFTPVTSPYLVRAVGPAGMAQRFGSSRAAKQLRWLQDKYQMGVAVREHDRVVLPAAPQPRLRYAKPSGHTASPSPTGSGR